MPLPQAIWKLVSLNIGCEIVCFSSAIYSLSRLLSVMIIPRIRTPCSYYRLVPWDVFFCRHGIGRRLIVVGLLRKSNCSVAVRWDAVYLFQFEDNSLSMWFSPVAILLALTSAGRNEIVFIAMFRKSWTPVLSWQDQFLDEFVPNGFTVARFAEYLKIQLRFFYMKCV